MPLGPGVRYRVVTKGGKKIRLAFKGKGQVVEAKNMMTGATHTPKEFAADRKTGNRVGGKGHGSMHGGMGEMMRGEMVRQMKH